MRVYRVPMIGVGTIVDPYRCKYIPGDTTSRVGGTQITGLVYISLHAGYVNGDATAVADVEATDVGYVNLEATGEVTRIS